MNRPMRSALAVLAVTASSAAVSPARAQERPDPARAPLAAGDRLLLRIWLDSSYVDTVRVDESVRVILPRVGPISLAGVPAVSIPDSVRSAIHALLTSRSIEVVPLRRVGVGGEVRKPGVYYVDLTTNLSDVISLAGGVGDIGDPKSVTLTRKGATTRVRDWVSENSVWAPLLSGDQVVVGRLSFVERNSIVVVTGISVLASIIFTLSRR